MDSNQVDDIVNLINNLNVDLENDNNIYFASFIGQTNREKGLPTNQNKKNIQYFSNLEEKIKICDIKTFDEKLNALGALGNKINESFVNKMNGNSVIRIIMEEHNRFEFYRFLQSEKNKMFVNFCKFLSVQPGINGQFEAFLSEQSDINRQFITFLSEHPVKLNQFETFLLKQPGINEQYAEFLRTHPGIPNQLITFLREEAGINGQFEKFLSTRSSINRQFEAFLSVHSDINRQFEKFLSDHPDINERFLIFLREQPDINEQFKAFLSVHTKQLNCNVFLFSEQTNDIIQDMFNYVIEKIVQSKLDDKKLQKKKNKRK